MIIWISGGEMKKTIIILILVLLSCTKESITDQQIDQSRLTRLGFDPALIQKALTTAASKGFIQGIIVQKGEEIAFENYFNGFDPELPVNIRSVSKSFLSVITGIVYEKGILKAMDEKVYTLFPEYTNYIKDDRFKEITYEHLLKMKAGFLRDEFNYTNIFSGTDWLFNIFSGQLSYIPGSSHVYATETTHLLGCAVARLTGQNLRNYANQNLFQYIGIYPAAWETDPKGNFFGGNNMFFKTRDLLNLGMLIRNRGVFNGRRIISESWVDECLKPQNPQSNLAWGKMTNISYGMLWWTGKINGYEVRTAIGHGGQFVMLVPALDLIIVTTANAYVGWDEADYNEQQIINIIGEYIVPAVK